MESWSDLSLSSRHEIADLVREQLMLHASDSLRIEVLETGVRKDGEWWHVPVRPTIDSPRNYEFYDTLSLVEGELTDDKHLSVLLIPAG